MISGGTQEEEARKDKSVEKENRSANWGRIDALCFMPQYFCILMILD